MLLAPSPLLCNTESPKTRAERTLSYQQGMITIVPFRQLERQIAQECERRDVPASQIIEDALKMYFGTGGWPALGIPIPEVRFMVFQGKPEVFTERAVALKRVEALAFEDRDLEPWSLSPTCQSLLNETVMVQNMGLVTKKLEAGA